MKPSALARRLLRAIYRSLVVYGSAFYTGVDPQGAAALAPAAAPFPAPVRELRWPGSAHPERVRLDVPLTPLERALLQELGSR